jgi:hypothetical protein
MALFFLGLLVAARGTAILEASFEAEILRGIKDPGAEQAMGGYGNFVEPTG